jgi:hypothetical protein
MREERPIEIVRPFPLSHKSWTVNRRSTNGAATVGASNKHTQAMLRKLHASISILLLLLLTASSTNLRTSVDIDTESIVNYLTSQTKWLRDRAELNINALRDSQGRIGPITMPNILLGDMVGEMDLPKTAPAPSKLEVKLRLAVVDPTQGSEEVSFIF